MAMPCLQLMENSCNICTPDVSQDDVCSEMSRLSRTPCEKLKSELIVEMGNATCALLSCDEEDSDITLHWQFVKIQHVEYSNQINEQLVTSMLEFDDHEQREHEKVQMDREHLKFRIASLEKQIDSAIEDRQLYCFCSSTVVGAWEKHYMCKTCYNAWSRQSVYNTCPFCRAVMNSPPVCMTWHHKKIDAEVDARLHLGNLSL